MLRIIGNTHQDRHHVTTKVKDAINTCGGWIVDFQLFSNLALSLHFEIPKQALTTLQEALQTSGIKISPDSLAAIQFAHSNPRAEIKGSLQITFIHNEPELRREVPAFS